MLKRLFCKVWGCKLWTRVEQMDERDLWIYREPADFCERCGRDLKK
jgi:hypothetical protein